jgi:hypothetical protein
MMEVDDASCPKSDRLIQVSQAAAEHHVRVWLMMQRQLRNRYAWCARLDRKRQFEAARIIQPSTATALV